MATMTITVPDRIQTALEKWGKREFDYPDAPTTIKHLLLVATGEGGVQFRLELEPVTNKGELPLFDAAKVPVTDGGEKP